MTGPAEGGAGREGPEWKRRERKAREEERRAEAEELGAGGGGGATAVPAHAFLYGVRGRGVGDGHAFLVLSSVHFGMHLLFSDGGQRGACSAPPARGQRRNRSKCAPL